jgi:hypothetical protein
MAVRTVKTGRQDEVIVKVSERGYHPTFEAIAAFYISEAGLNRHQHAVATAGECTKCFGAHDVKSCTVKFAQ